MVGFAVDVGPGRIFASLPTATPRAAVGGVMWPAWGWILGVVFDMLLRIEYPLIGSKDKLPSVVPVPFSDAPDAPLGAILCYPRWLLREVIETEAPRVHQWPYRGDVYRLKSPDSSIALVGSIGVGAPAAAMLVEELGGQGVTKFIVIGMAGAIQPRLQPCDFAVADRALRDEGVSHHYLPAGRYSTPSASLTARLTTHLKTSRQPIEVGASWTTDAPYRETAQEVRRYRDEGVLTVEMEAPAVFTVAEVRVSRRRCVRRQRPPHRKRVDRPLRCAPATTQSSTPTPSSESRHSRARPRQIDAIRNHSVHHNCRSR